MTFGKDVRIELHARSSRLSIGAGVTIGDRVVLEVGPHGSLEIGAGSWLHVGVLVCACSAVILEEDVMIGEYSSVRDADHSLDDPAGPRRGGFVESPIVIEGGAWVGRGVAVLKGVRIGRRAVVAANAVVTKNVEQGTVVGGVPARIIRRATTLEAQARAQNDPQVGSVMIKVLHVIPAIAGRYGGPSQVVGALCRALNRISGVVAEIATTDADGMGGTIPFSALPHGVKTHLFHRFGSERWKPSLQLGLWLHEHAGDYDLVHVHAIWSFASTAGAAAARRAGKPYVVRPAGMLSRYSMARHAIGKRVYWAALERRTVSEAAAIHATSRVEADEAGVVSGGVTTFVIPNGIDEAAWSAPRWPSALRERCGSPGEDVPIVLFLGRLHPKKGIVDILLPALAALRRPALLAIAGGRDDHAPEYEAEISQAVRAQGLEAMVRSLGPVSPDERWSLLDGAAAFVLPSHSENFGIAAAEAMARGCPVMVSDKADICEHVRKAGAGVIVPVASDLWAEALERFLADGAGRAQMGEAGRVYAKATLTWERAAQATSEMYRAL